MKTLSFAIIISSLIGAAVYLETIDKDVSGIWVLIVLLLLFGDRN